MAAAAPTPNDKASGPRSRKGAETRARLVAAAKEIFEENGFLDARISDIAERAGLSHGSFYHYFESKEEIFREVAYAVGDQLSAPLGEVVLDPESEASPQDRIRQAIRMHLESYRKEARIMGVIEQVSRYDAEMRHARFEQQRRYGEQVEDSIRRMQRHGMIDPDLDPVIASAALGSMTTRFPELWLVEGALKCSFEDAAEQLARVFINGLGFKEGVAPRKKRGRSLVDL